MSSTGSPALSPPGTTTTSAAAAASSHSPITYPSPSRASPGGLSIGGSGKAARRSGSGGRAPAATVNTTAYGEADYDDEAAVAPSNARGPSAGRLSTPTKPARVTTPTQTGRSTTGTSSSGSGSKANVGSRASPAHMSAAASANASPSLTAAAAVAGGGRSGSGGRGGHLPRAGSASSASARRARALAAAVLEADMLLAARRAASASSSAAISRRKLRKFEMDHVFGLGASASSAIKGGGGLLRSIDETRKRGGLSSGTSTMNGLPLDPSDVRAVLELQARQRSNLAGIVDWRCLFSELFRDRNERALRAFLSCEDAVYKAPSSGSGSNSNSNGSTNSVARVGAAGWARVQNRIRPVVLRALGNSTTSSSSSGNSEEGDGNVEITTGSSSSSSYSAAALVLAAEAVLLHFAETGTALEPERVPRTLREKLARPLRVHTSTSTSSNSSSSNEDGDLADSGNGKGKHASNASAKGRSGKKKGNAGTSNAGATSGIDSVANVPGALEIALCCTDPCNTSTTTYTNTSTSDDNMLCYGLSAASAFDRLLLYATAQFHDLHFKNVEASDGSRVMLVLRKKRNNTSTSTTTITTSTATTTATTTTTDAPEPPQPDATASSIGSTDTTTTTGANAAIASHPSVSLVAFVHQRYLRSSSNNSSSSNGSRKGTIKNDDSNNKNEEEEEKNCEARAE